MAAYSELLLASENATLRNQVRVALIIAAQAVYTEDSGTANHAARLAWAKATILNPTAVVEPMLWAVLAQNAGFTLAQIQGATDATVQTAVAAAVNLFI